MLLQKRQEALSETEQMDPVMVVMELLVMEETVALVSAVAMLPLMKVERLLEEMAVTVHQVVGPVELLVQRTA